MMMNSVKFGNASRHLEAARSALRTAEAQLSQDANSLAADAAKAIDDVLGSSAR